MYLEEPIVEFISINPEAVISTSTPCGGEVAYVCVNNVNANTSMCGCYEGEYGQVAPCDNDAYDLPCPNDAYCDQSVD